MCHIRAARKHDVDELNRIACESEAYWGYDEKFMERFKEVYRITEDFICSNPTFILVEGSHVIGFYALIETHEGTELEYFYIDPRFIGKGYGKKMLERLIDYCREAGVKSFSLVTSPQAKGFYERMGAVVVGEVESLLREGRRIPRLRYEIT